jgi:uncharacterized RDD family membrane protein YckC
MPYCETCGTEYPTGQNSCTNCNNSLQVVEEIPTSAKTQLTDREITATKSRRIIAGIIDIVVVIALGLLMLSPRLRLLNMIGLKKFLSFFIPAFYLLLKDSFDGKSIGKLFTGLTVFNTIEKKPAGIGDNILRNWVILIPFVPIILFIQIIIKNKRWGDEMAHTIVIKDSAIEEE